MTSPGRSGEGHTPGPWFADLHNERRDCGRFYVFVTAAGLVPICAVTSGVEGYGREEGQANANLIGAAPDLKEAGEALLAAAERHIFGDECKAERDAMRAAIAKATGKATQ